MVIDVFLLFLFSANNVFVLFGPLALLSHSTRLWKVLPHLVLAMSILNLALLIIGVIYARDLLKAGYYLWCVSYVLLACGLYLNRRERLSASQE